MNTETVTYYAIRNTVDPTDWWSNEDGWTFHVPSRDIFTEEERNTLNLPQDGEWVEADPGAGEFDEEFPDEHSHEPEFSMEDGSPRANLHACDSEGRHYYLSAKLTHEGVIFDVWDRYGEECLATFARTYDELVDFVFALDPMQTLAEKMEA